MAAGLTEEQSELADILRDALGSIDPVRADVADSVDATAWELLCGQIGIGALAFPEDNGGLGFGFVETHVVLEQLGYALSDLPYLGSVVLGGTALLALDVPDDAREEWQRLVEGVASGETVVALAQAAQGAITVDAAGALSGSIPLVLDAARAHVLLVAVPSADGVRVHRVDPASPGVQVRVRAAVDPTMSFADVVLDGAASALVGVLTQDAAARLERTAIAATASLLVGVAQRGLDMTVEYSTQRVQFGRQIGSFQALKHRMADMLVAVESSRSIALAAATAIAADAPDAEHIARTAKAWCADAATLVAAETIQLHGGVGITWEHSAHLVFKKTHALSTLFGTAATQRAALGEELRSA